jgi:hypothetical protein
MCVFPVIFRFAKNMFRFVSAKFRPKIWRRKRNRIFLHVNKNVCIYVHVCVQKNVFMFVYVRVNVRVRVHVRVCELVSVLHPGSLFMSGSISIH